MAERPIRFSIGTTRELGTPEGIQRFARRVESLGFFALHYPDHFPTPYAPLLTLLHAAEVTERIHLSTLVLNNDLRHPAVLAKEAVTLDHLTGGRFILGMGAGTTKFEFDQAGIPFEKPSLRIARLRESLIVLKGLFGDDPFSFAGSSYRIDHMNGTPKPVTRPRLPILVGGGSQKILELAGEQADIVSIAARTGPTGMIDVDDALPGRLDMKIGWVKAAAKERFADLDVAGLLFKIVVTNDPIAGAREALEYFRATRRVTGVPVYHLGDDLTPEAVMDSPCFAFGTVKQIAEHFREVRERFGISYFTVSHNEPEDLAPIIEELGET